MVNSDTPRRIEPDDVMTLEDVQARLGMSRNGAAALVERDGFPEPFRVVWRSRLWRRSDVEEWCVEQAAAGWIYEPFEAEATRGQ